ncbi:Protein translocase subunit SecD [hydrothermal vent metagenome]|uniref:Protein translocase subunit SecD n=1 Tax=hydrothermal vent metagenome TaxID=652676 RepID=A0A3B0ZBF3_9ZZZZ
MMNQYPVWKYTLISAICLLAVLFALPNLFGNDPALQVSATRSTVVDASTEVLVRETLTDAGVKYKSAEITPQGLLVRFENTAEQLKAQQRVKFELGSDYIVALNLAPATPDWLQSLGADPMFLGLDLRGGVHFLMEVDMNAAIKSAETRYKDEVRGLLRTNKIRYLSISQRATGGVHVKLRDEKDLALTRELLGNELKTLDQKEDNDDGRMNLLLTITEDEIRSVKSFALQQNMTTLRNRVNELGVSEPVIQQQGLNRIVVQLPGIQDTARAKEILGATATLEFRMADETGDVQNAMEGRSPIGSKLYRERNGSPILLKKRIIVTGDQITDAASGIDQQDGSAAVFISLDGKGAKKMLDTTKANVGKLMAVVFIENKTDIRLVDGEEVRTKRRIEEVINVARIREAFSHRFQITGLDSTEEARDLALLLRAGALSAPMDIVEERTVGPSLGQDNIDKGFLSVQMGFLLVLIFMAVYYRTFGLIACVALTVNLVLLVAVLSLIQATLTLPGIAGIVLTVGMAVDANVLIFERIREEIRNGNSPQASIQAGYEKALSTIADANITTFIVAIVLFGLGTGAIKGFAVTLSIGILTSMFTAIMGTRAIVNLIYGGKRIEKLSI